jgi:dimethylglycine dehydrogenase
MVKPGNESIGTGLDIKLLGKLHRAIVIEESPFDPTNERLRADG